MYALNDISHLAKNMRNAMLNNKILEMDAEYVLAYSLVSGEVKWAHIVHLYEFCYERKLKIAGHLTKADIELTSFSKMRVAPALHVLSRKTGNALRWLVSHYPKEFGREYLTTAIFCEKAGLFLDLAANYSKSMAFWANDPNEKNADKIADMLAFVRFYCRMKLHKNQKENTLKPSQTGVMITVDSIIAIVKKALSVKDFHYFLTKCLLNDRIERFHGDHKAIQKSPTCLQFKQNSKIISITDYMGHGKHGSYGVNDERGFLTDFKSIKQFLDEEKHVEETDIANLNALEFAPRDFAELASLAYLVGYLLKVTILTDKSNCKNCALLFVVDFEKDDQEVNSLITAREYKAGALVRPSRLANALFKRLEGIFRAKSETFAKLKNINNILTIAFVKEAKEFVKESKENFPQVPDCHFELMFRRFAKIRLHFEGEFLNSKLQNRQRDEIENSAYGSKSSKGVNL